MKKDYVTKPYRQRTSVVTTIPRQIKERLELKKGDYLYWQDDEKSNFVQISNLDVWSKKDGRDRTNPDSED